MKEKILITGANGFIAQNLIVFLSESNQYDILKYTRKNTDEDLKSFVKQADFIVHLAGINRPKDDAEFKTGNEGLTQKIASYLTELPKLVPIIFSSSIQADKDNLYGNSKQCAENCLIKTYAKNKTLLHIFRLPNVYGKWSKPNYNSAVATFCHLISHGQSPKINDPRSVINLVYIDDVAKCFLNIINGNYTADIYAEVAPVNKITVGELAEIITEFKEGRTQLRVSEVGNDFIKSLYSTYLSFMPKSDFTYPLKLNSDARGSFAEVLRTDHCGQFSFFTAKPGQTRGQHYHHTKTEKFVVVKGTALFRFRNVLTNEYYELTVTGDRPEVVETVPGWIHDISNTGNDDIVVMLWANEVFDTKNPDTIYRKTKE